MRYFNDTAFYSEDIFACGDNGYIYFFRQDKVCDSKIRADKSSIQAMRFIERKG